MLATAAELLAIPWAAPCAQGPAAFDSSDNSDGHISPFPRARIAAPAASTHVVPKANRRKAQARMIPLPFTTGRKA